MSEAVRQDSGSGGVPRPADDSLSFAMLHYGLPGLIASALMALGAVGVGWLPLDSPLYEISAVETLRQTTAGMALSRLMIIVGLAVMLQTWLILGYDLLASMRMRLSNQSAVLLAWSAPLLLAPPLFSRDVYSYLAQGRLLAEGEDPYSAGVSTLPNWFVEGVDPMWGETPSPYGPLFLVLARGVAAFVGDQAFLGALMFRLMAVVGVVMMAYFVPRLARAHGIDPGKALWLAVLNPLVIMHFVAGGHNDALMMGLVLAGLSLAVDRRIAAAAALIALAASIKPIALLALPFIGIARTPHGWTWRKRIGDWVYVSVIAGAVFLVTAVLAGVGFGWISALTTPGEVKTWLSPVTAVGMVLGGALQLLGVVATNDGAVAVMRGLGTIAAIVLVTYLCLKPQGRSATRGAALAFLAVVALGPVVHPWYVLWVLPLFVVTGLSSWQLRASILLTVGLTVHGMVESSSTADTLVNLSSGLAILTSIGVVALILIASPRERSLVLGQGGPEGLTPETPEERMRSSWLDVDAPQPAPSRA
jgi:hypothetical protein